MESSEEKSIDKETDITSKNGTSNPFLKINFLNP